MFFRLKKGVGGHTQLNDEGVPTVYKAGDAVKSNVDLVKCFPRKFARLDIDDTAKPNLAPGIPMSSVVASADAAPLASEASKPKESLGEDITAQYKLPKGKNIKVFTKGGGWCTIRIDDNSEKDEKLRMNAVQTWIDLAS